MPRKQHGFSPRERFLRTMRYETCDRPPLWEEGVMDETWEAWRSQGLVSPQEFRTRHGVDRHELAELNLFPVPEFQHSATEGFPELRGRYRADTADRLPKGWPAVAESWAARDYPLGITVSRGLLLSCGVRNWSGLVTVLQSFYDRPEEIDATMACVTEMALSLLKQLTEKATPDFAVFNEPVASFHGPVLSPEHYRRFCFPCYARLIQALRGMGVSVLVVRTWGNALPLIPLWLELGLDTLWNEHCNAAGVDYVALRRRFGKELRLIGGIDSRALYQDRRAVDDAIERVVPSLLEGGGYLPSVDDRVRSNVPFETYRYYRERLTRLVAGG